MKTCLIKLPNVVNEPLIPDLGLGILVALLRSKGVDIYQADLKPLLRKSHELHTHLLNIRRDSSKKYLTGCSPDSELLKLVDKLLSRHRLDKFDLLGFSLDVESNLFPNLALIKAIKGKTGAKTRQRRGPKRPRNAIASSSSSTLAGRTTSPRSWRRCGLGSAFRAGTANWLRGWLRTCLTPGSWWSSNGKVWRWPRAPIW